MFILPPPLPPQPTLTIISDRQHGFMMFASCPGKYRAFIPTEHIKWAQTDYVVKIDNFLNQPCVKDTNNGTKRKETK